MQDALRSTIDVETASRIAGGLLTELDPIIRDARRSLADVARQDYDPQQVRDVTAGGRKAIDNAIALLEGYRAELDGFDQRDRAQADAERGAR